MLKTFFIFLCIILFSQIQSLPTINEKNSPNEDQDDKSLTRNTMKTLDEILHRIKEFNSTINHQLYYFRGSKTDTTRKNSIDNEVMENPDLFQGDMILTKTQADDLVENVVEIAKDLGADVSDIFGNAETRKKRKIDMSANFTWDLTIPYTFDNHVKKELIREALNKLQNETCLSFKEYSDFIPQGQAGLKYIYGQGCYSNVGRAHQDKHQIISIGKGCELISTIQHETMHALGFVHEQSRDDRNRYLKVYLENVKPGTEENFIKLGSKKAKRYDIPYDYGSAMHYSSYAFTKNKEPTMLPLNPVYKKTLGSKSEATFLDIKLLNKHYCSNKCSSRITCTNNGYQDPNSCERCKCLKGFTGRDCSEIEKDISCGDQELFADDNNKTLNIKGKKDCVYHIRSKDENKNVSIVVGKVNIYPTYGLFCYAGNRLEVKFESDKTKSGAFVCSKTGETFESEDNYAIIYYKSMEDANYANIYYQLK
uniref:Zinc metalloproteinase n=1 Tax=Strongyloides papillosus TaxID=174720 RepID=A0A0N5C2U0_STREA